MSNAHQLRIRRICRALVFALVVFGQLLGTFGWATSTTIRVRAKGPCGHRPCGCTIVDAASHCCCEAPEPAPVRKSCCEPTPKRSCCEKSRTSATDTDAKASRCCGSEPPPRIKESKSRTWLADIMAQRCRGEAPPSASAGDPEIPPSPVSDCAFAQASAERLLPYSDHLHTPAGDPPIPPPRLG
jgi:hypothetical protein